MLEFLSKINDLLSAILPILISIGVILFVWGVVQYVIAGGEEAKKKGKDRIIYGILGMVVILSLWGIVTMITGYFDTSAGAPLEDINRLAPTSLSQNKCSQIKSGNGNTLSNYMDYVTCIINYSVIPLIFALAVVMFVWGAVKFFIINSDEEAKRTQGKQFMIWAIVAFAVMLSLWGLVGIIRSTFFPGSSNSFLPQVKP